MNYVWLEAWFRVSPQVFFREKLDLEIQANLGWQRQWLGWSFCRSGSEADKVKLAGIPYYKYLRPYPNHIPNHTPNPYPKPISQTHLPNHTLIPVLPPFRMNLRQRGSGETQQLYLDGGGLRRLPVEAVIASFRDVPMHHDRWASTASMALQIWSCLICLIFCTQYFLGQSF